MFQTRYSTTEREALTVEVGEILSVGNTIRTDHRPHCPYLVWWSGAGCTLPSVFGQLPKGGRLEGAGGGEGRHPWHPSFCWARPMWALRYGPGLDAYLTGYLPLYLPWKRGGRRSRDVKRMVGVRWCEVGDWNTSSTCGRAGEPAPGSAVWGFNIWES